MTRNGIRAPVFSRIDDGMKIALSMDDSPMILFSGAAVETISTPELSRAEAGRALSGETSGWEAIQPGEMMVTGEVVYFVPAAEKEVVAFRVQCDQRFVGLSEAGDLFRARRNGG